MPDVKTLFWLLGFALLLPPCAKAQVRVNPDALRQLQGLPPALPAAPVPLPTLAAPPTHKPPRHHQSIEPAPPADRVNLPAPPPPPLPPPPLPQTPLPQTQATPRQTPVNPQPPTSAAHPTPDVTLHLPVLPPVVRLDFTPNSAILPVGAEAIVKPFCTTKGRVSILARAPATPDNPGMAMQLSMQRAFAIRAALIACGVPAQNIIPQSTVGVSDADSNEALVGAHIRP